MNGGFWMRNMNGGGGGVIMIYKEWYVLGMMLRERVGSGGAGECMLTLLGVIVTEETE